MACTVNFLALICNCFLLELVEIRSIWDYWRKFSSRDVEWALLLLDLVVFGWTQILLLLKLHPFLDICGIMSGAWHVSSHILHDRDNCSPVLLLMILVCFSALNQFIQFIRYEVYFYLWRWRSHVFLIKRALIFEFHCIFLLDFFFLH